MKLIEGKKYILYNTPFTYIGYIDSTGHYCDKCHKPRKYLHWFHKGKVDNPTSILKYGNECIKHIKISK